MLREGRVKFFTPQNTAGISQEKALQSSPKQLKWMLSDLQTLKKYIIKP